MPSNEVRGEEYTQLELRLQKLMATGRLVIGWDMPPPDDTSGEFAVMPPDGIPPYIGSTLLRPPTPEMPLAA